MAFMSWATHTLQWPVQWVAKPRGEANPQSWSQFRLQAATRLHEDGGASNRRSAILCLTLSQDSHTPPVKSCELETPQAGIRTVRKEPSRVWLLTGTKS